ncbi:protein FAM110A [Pygocentrus nattereri]|uniref:Family with sequence similarity 110 member A n=1 Tax=Pygocentrus nattereri TaxID=42514 RepID=A0A3B4CGC1_PYGNA|nr:protein FAM110A [Pygocentrus nattereri]
MSVDTLDPSSRRLTKMPDTQSSTGPRKPSAVERLEADKAKYVKSQQVALSKQMPVVRKPLMAPDNSRQLRPGAMQPTRKTPTRSTAKCEAPPLDLKHLSNLINGVSDTIVLSTRLQSDSPEKTDKSEGFNPSQLLAPISTLDEEPSIKSISSSVPPVKLLADGSGTNVSCTVTVRRVDVRPQVPQMRKPRTPQQQNRPPLQLPEQRVHSQLLQLLRPYTQPQPQPLKPIGIISRRDVVIPKLIPLKTSTSPVETLPSAEPLKSPTPALLSPVRSPKDTIPDVPPLASPAIRSSASTSSVPPPSSPAITRKSSVSSRKRPSLTRSKSDVSDRFSRAGAEVERFFNYCGLDPSDFEELEPGSDIASVSRLRSASAPASERSAEGQEEDEEEEAAKDEKPSYGISVIERNARVIKWLYGMRQAKDSTKVANM